MKIEFVLAQRLIGMSLTSGRGGEHVHIQTAEIALASDAEMVQQRLDALQTALFSHVPGLLDPRLIHSLFVVIHPDLKATAYVNETNVVLETKVTRAVKAGEPVLVKDVSDISGAKLSVEVPDSAALVHFASMLWRRTVYFDFNPLSIPPRPRVQPIEVVLTEQYRSLWGLPSGLPDVPDAFAAMSDGVQELSRLRSASDVPESALQELLQRHPWMLGGNYSQVDRHTTLDDENIPDFTATKTSDRCLDIVELKRPDAKCFRADGSLSSEFHDAWTQVERYLAFADRNRDYLHRQKNLLFENPRAILLIGREFSEEARRRIREKEAFNGRITILNYDQLYDQANSILTFVRGASVGRPSFGS